ncbi:MAG: Wzz/FepE/Etk N-terminal domain-containing protein [Acidobacteriota bacterium]
MEFNPLETSARDIAFIVFKRKWSLLIIVAVTMVSTAFWIWFIRRDVYQVAAKVLVKIGHEQAAASTVGGPPIMITGERLQDVNSEVEILKSADLLAQLVDHFGLDKPRPPDPPPAGFLPRLRYHIREAMRRVREWRDEQFIRLGLRERLSPRELAIYELQQGLVVAAERNSTVITAQLLSPWRRDAGAFLNTLLDFYQAFRLKVYHDRSAVVFFRGEVDRASESLRSAEDEMRRFEKAWDISAIERQREVLLSELSGWGRQLSEAEIALEEALAKTRRFDAEMKSSDPNLAAVGAFAPNSFPDTLLQQLAALEREREMLRMTELDAGPRIQNNRSQFKAVLGMLGANLRATLAEKQSVFQAHRQALAACQAKLRSLQEKETEWGAIKRRIRILEENYLLYRRKLEDTTAAAAMEQKRIGNVVVIAHAVDPVVPVGTRKMTLLGLALMAGVFTALAWAAVAEFFDNRVYSAEALEQRLGAPVLGVVPAARPRRWSRKRPYASGE